MTEREKIAARARHLAAMTVENGCSEAEALTAARKLASLLERYNMTTWAPGSGSQPQPSRS
jgi:hypothetical protein